MKDTVFSASITQWLFFLLHPMYSWPCKQDSISFDHCSSRIWFSLAFLTLPTTCFFKIYTIRLHYLILLLVAAICHPSCHLLPALSLSCQLVKALSTFSTLIYCIFLLYDFFHNLGDFNICKDNSSCTLFLTF